MQASVSPLWAVHIADGFLSLPWLLGGFVLAGLLLVSAVVIDVTLVRLTGRDRPEEEIAQMALLTAAFFVASQIHVPIGPFFTVHLLLNGLLGIILRWRAAIAIPVGLLLQAVLFQHGGLGSLGVNACVLVIPALAAWLLFAGLRRLPWLTHPLFRGLLVCLSAVSLLLGALFSITLIATNDLSNLDNIEASRALEITLQPLSFGLACFAGAVLAVLERRLENAPEFPLGLFVGMLTVQLTMLMNAVVLFYGGAEDLRSVAMLTFVAHMPIAILEGFVLGTVVGFLAKVRPSLLA